MIDGSEPLEGFREQFALHVFGGDKPIDAYRKIYPKAAQKTAESNSCNIHKERKVRVRIAWLRKQVASEKVLSVEKKRSYLFEVVTELPVECRDKLTAIKIDNEMAGHNKPTEVKHTGEVTLLVDAVKAITHGLAKR